MSLKRAKNNENGAYTSSSNAEIEQKTAKAQLKRKRKAKETATKGVKDWHRMLSGFLQTQQKKIAIAQRIGDAKEKEIVVAQ